jgi:hypothetical protein
VNSAFERVVASRFVRRDLRAAIVPWVLARFLVGGGLAVARFVQDQIGRTPRPVPLGQGLFAWDAAFYRDIAIHGYGAMPKASLRFFPLYPLTGKVLGWVLAGHTAVALLVIANGSALVFGALLHRLAELETGDARLARRAAWFAAIFPAASVLVMGYAEPLFMALATGVFLALRMRRWELAGALGLLAGACRPLGVVLVVPALIEVWRPERALRSESPPEPRAGPEGPRPVGRERESWGSATTRDRLGRIGAVVGPGVGLGLYLVYAGLARDDFFLPLTVQNRKSLRGGFVDPVTSVVHAFQHLFNGDRFGSGLHGVWAVVFLALLVVLVRRFPASYSAYAGAVLLLTLTADNLDSFERYAMSTIPFLLALAAVTGQDDVDRGALVVAAGGLAAYAILGFLGATVP